MKKQALILACALIAFCSNAHALDFDFQKLLGAAQKLQQTSQEIDEPHEISIGKGIAANLLGAAPLVSNISLQKYVNIVGRWLSLQTERPDLPWQFGVLESDDVNAFATPGGTVFITRGLLGQMSSESELAGVLAHEMAHVLQKHHLAALQKSTRVGIATELLGEALKKQADAEKLDRAIKAGTEIYARGLDKDDEFEADRMGIVIAARAGYDPYGLASTLQILDGLNPQDTALALMFKTHPAPRERLALLETLLQENLERYATQPQMAQRFKMLTRQK